MTVKTEKGQIAKADAMRPYMCQLLGKVKGGKEGRTAAAQGAKTQNNADVTVKDVYVFSREIAREAKGNALAVTARHKGRPRTIPSTPSTRSSVRPACTA